MYNQVDPNDSRWLYNASQLGAIQRVDQKTGLAKNIRPTPAQGEPPYRFKGMAPLVPSGEYLVVLEMANKKIAKRALIKKMPET